MLDLNVKLTAYPDALFLIFAKLKLLININFVTGSKSNKILLQKSMRPFYAIKYDAYFQAQVQVQATSLIPIQFYSNTNTGCNHHPNSTSKLLLGS